MPLPARPAHPSFNPEIERLLYQLQVVIGDADGILYGLTGDQFNWRAAAGQWSVGQCFEHLNRVNQVFTENLRVAIEEGRRKGWLNEGPYSYNFLSRWFMRQVEPPLRRKFKTPARFAPPEKLSPDEVKSEFMRLHERVGDLLKGASGLDLVRTKAASLMPVLKFNLGMTFWIVFAHDRRHIAQARAVRNATAFPK